MPVQLVHGACLQQHRKGDPGLLDPQAEGLRGVHVLPGGDAEHGAKMRRFADVLRSATGQRGGEPAVRFLWEVDQLGAETLCAVSAQGFWRCGGRGAGARRCEPTRGAGGE